MTHLYTRGCEYAIRALLALVADPDRRMTVPEFCERAEIPEPFTRKMVQQLARAGILLSKRGPGGGFELGRSADEISLMDVVIAIDERPRTDQCVIGRAECNDRNPCPLHDAWAPIKAASIRMLETQTLAKLAPSTSPPATSRARGASTRRISRSKP